MKKHKRRKFMGDAFCWATALATCGWMSAEPETSQSPKEPPPKKIPEPDVQPCYGVAPPPPKPER